MLAGARRRIHEDELQSQVAVSMWLGKQSARSRGIPDELRTVQIVDMKDCDEQGSIIAALHPLVMATPTYIRSLVCWTKRLKLSPGAQSQQYHVGNVHTSLRSHVLQAPVAFQRRQQSTDTVSSIPPNGHEPSLIDSSIATKEPPPIDVNTAAEELAKIRLPRAVQATYLTPLRRKVTHGIPTCDLQIRSYSVRNLEVYADFAMRAAYYLNLPAKGPVPLPKITERWTIPRSNFVHKKSQENFERVTTRRLIQIQDGHPETVAIWLSFLQKYRHYGIGMKANVWEHGGLDVAGELDAEAEKLLKPGSQPLFELVGGKPKVVQDEQKMERGLVTEPLKAAWGAYAPMSGNTSVPDARSRMDRVVVEAPMQVSKFRRSNNVENP